VELQVGEFQDEFLQRLGGWLWRDGHFRREPFAHRNEDRIHRRLDPAGGAAHGNVNRLMAEQFFEDAELGAVEREHKDREIFPAALLLHRECVLQFLADPLGLQRIRADHNRHGRRVFNSLLDFRQKRIACAQLARINPDLLLKVGERPAEFAHERVVQRAVGDEEFRHG
jgi:hypothetical protein